MAKRTASAKKQARAGARRAALNRSTRSEVKTLITKARAGLRSGAAASEKTSSTVDAIRALDRASAKRVLHRNNAGRRKSRLARQLAKVAGAGASAPAPVAAKGKKGAAATAAPAAAAAAKKK